MDRNELLKLTLRQPTARLSESEAAERAEDLRQRGHLWPDNGHDQRPTPAFVEFARDWYRVMAREN